MTEYLGVRSSHGQVKLYNKALERGLESDLTRLEITVDYERCSWGEFQRLFPVVLDNGSQLPDDLTGTLLWLVDDKSSGFVNGVVVPVDGGFAAYSGV